VVVRVFGGKFPVMSLEDLEALFRSSTVDLIRRFGARRVGDKYLIPVQGVPWFTLVDLGRDYLINGLVVRGVSVTAPLDRPWFNLILGFLVGDYVLGVSLVGRKTLPCRSVPLDPPLDLWDLPRGSMVFSRPLAVVREVSTSVLDVSVPWDCLGDLGVSVDASLTTRYLLVYSNLVSVGDRVFVDFSSSVITSQG
jgi:hypothetical protein